MNNINIYLFGVLKNGYTQSVDDYTRPLFEEFVHHATAPTQLFVRRKDQLIYYGYVRRLDMGNACIGLCVEANDCLFANVRKLFSLFEEVMEQMLLEGKIVALDSAMRTAAVIADFSEVPSEVEMAISRVQSRFSTFSDLEHLPFAATNISHDSLRKLSHDVSADEAKASFVRNGLTIILKQEDYEGEMMTKYRRQIEELQKNLEQKRKEAETLHQALSRTVKEVEDLKQNHVVPTSTSNSATNRLETVEVREDATAPPTLSNRSFTSPVEHHIPAMETPLWEKPRVSQTSTTTAQGNESGTRWGLFIFLFGIIFCGITFISLKGCKSNESSELPTEAPYSETTPIPETPTSEPAVEATSDYSITEEGSTYDDTPTTDESSTYDDAYTPDESSAYDDAETETYADDSQYE